VEFRAAADRAAVAADIVVANILAHPLIVLAPLLARLTASGGRLALAGILASQSPEVRAAYAPWFDIHEAGEEENWVLLAGARR
jgi:ribosomal protein L11 methyltransferase